MFVSMAQGLEDLHLQPGSPCIDLSDVNSVNIDIDGEARPFGIRRDSGADEYVPPDMAVEYNAAAVNHLGGVNVGGVPQNGAGRVFTIRNVGLGRLVLNGNPLVELTPGTNCASSTIVQVQPALTQLAPNDFTTFTLFIDPVATGAFSLSISIAGNDPNKNPYTFTVTGDGLPPNQPAFASAAGSNFTGPQNGPFVYVAQPGAALANAFIELSDPETDSITVVAITPQAATPLGVNAPAVPAPGFPLFLTWTGTVSAANVPQSFGWVIQFRDSVNATLILCLVTIQVANAPPEHTIAGALGGDGSAGNPYLCEFNRGDDGTALANLCAVTDPNTSQTPFLGSASGGAGNPGVVGFDFTLAAGVLRVAPAAMLTVAEAGSHAWLVQVSDGANVVSIHVSIAVNNTALNFSTPSILPEGESGTAYAATLAVTGAFGAVTFTLTAGPLPDGLALDTNTGQISGTPTEATQSPVIFTIEAEDATGATASRQFQVTIIDPPTPPGPNEQAKGDGCVVGSGGWGALSLLAGLALWARRKKPIAPSKSTPN